MRLDAKLAKMEEQARAVIRCAWCLYVLTDNSGGGAGKPAKTLPAVCAWCGTSYGVSVAALTERQIEVARIFYQKHDGEKFRDARVYAAEQWFYASLFVKRWRDGGMTLEKVQERQRRKQEAQSVKPTRQQRERAELKDRAHKFLDRMTAREERLHGPYKHELHDQLTALKEPTERRLAGSLVSPEDRYAERVAELALHRLSIMKLCEGVLWGGALPETLEDEREARAAVERVGAAREAREREIEEERAKREAEREAERQRQQAEREARMNPRPAPPPPVTAPARSRVDIPWVGEPPVSEGNGGGFYDFTQPELVVNSPSARAQRNDFYDLLEEFRDVGRQINSGDIARDTLGLIRERERLKKLALDAYNCPVDASTLLTLFRSDPDSAAGKTMLQLARRV